MTSVPDADDPSLIDTNDINVNPEEVINTLNTRFNITDLSQHSVCQKAKFYEKQANLLGNKIDSKIKELETKLNNKFNIVRITRRENHML